MRDYAYSRYKPSTGGCGNYLNPDDTGKNTDNTTSSISDLPVAGLYDESIISDYNKYNESQMNSLAMLNYYCIIAQNIISSKETDLFSNRFTLSFITI